MTQAELARRLDMKPAAISRLETSYSNVTLDTLTRLSEALDIEPWRLLVDDRPDSDERVAALLVGQPDDVRRWVLQLVHAALEHPRGR